MKLNIYMKSGNKIKVCGVKNWEVKVNGNEVVSLTIYRKNKLFRLLGEDLIIKSVDLSQIEAVTQEW